MKLFSFFFPQKITEVQSLINKKIEVVEQFGKRAIRVEGLEQSGPMVEKIWEKGIRELQATSYPGEAEDLRRSLDTLDSSRVIGPRSKNRDKLQATKILILGLGGGSAVKVINKYFPKAKILGIEIDPLMIRLGKKYLALSEHKNLEIKIADAFKWLKNFRLNDLNHLNRFDLILVDLYLGEKAPKGVKDEEFLNSVKRILASDGIVIFNFLRRKDERQLLDKLGKVYHHIKVIRPVINYLVICQ